MKVASFLYQDNCFCREVNEEYIDFEEVQFVLGFGSKELLTKNECYIAIRKRFSKAELLLCSSAGEIFDKEVYNNSVSLVAIQFVSTKLKTSEVNINDFSDSYEAGKALISKLSQEGLKLIFVLSDGSQVNGSELVKGVNSTVNGLIPVTGGLAGDGSKFEETFVGLNQLPAPGKIIAVGFYGCELEVSHGSFGGWDSFGLERIVTKAKGNVLYEIDHKNALNLYKTYLGKYANELPGSALLFPLSIKLIVNQEIIVRTILSIDEENQSLTFAGDIPEGSRVRFMKANFDRLVDAASDAANACLEMNNSVPKLAILISCVGRKLILGNRIDEEVEAVSDIFNNKTMLMGFYSYGEISPLRVFGNCELHNQTMTITCLNEL